MVIDLVHLYPIQDIFEGESHGSELKAFPVITQVYRLSALTQHSPEIF